MQEITHRVWNPFSMTRAFRRILGLLLASACLAIPAGAAPIEDSIVLPNFWIGYNGAVNQATMFEEVPIAANSSTGSLSANSLQAGTLYELTARGTYQWAGNQRADAECSRESAASGGQTALAAPWFERQISSADPAADVLDVYVNGGPVNWFSVGGPGRPTREASQDCDQFDHLYTYLYSPPASGKLPLKIYDTSYGDNGGAIYVAVRQLKTPRVIKLVDTIDVDVSSPNGTAGLVGLTRGKVYMALATGTWQYDSRFSSRLADAECSTSGGTSSWSRNAAGRPVPIRDPYDLRIGGQQVEWVGDSSSGANCSISGHRYRHTFISAADGPIQLGVDDHYYADNTGNLRVEVYLVELGV